MTSSPVNLLPPVLGSIIGGIIGAMTTYWLNLRPSQIKDKEIRLLESCGHLDEKIKDVLKYLQDCDIDISELRSQYLLTAAPGLRGTELDLVLYVEYENRLHEIYRKARDLIRAFQTQPDEAEASAEAVQATITEDSPVQNGQAGDMFRPGAQSERGLRGQLVEVDRAHDVIEAAEIDMAPHASIIDDRLPLELIQAVSTSAPPGSIPSPEELGEIAGYQRSDATPSSTPPDENIREDNDDLRLEGHDSPPHGLDALWPQAPTEGLFEAPPLEADLARRASVSTWPDMMEDIADGMRVAYDSPRSSESEFEQTRNNCCCFCGQEFPMEAKHWESLEMGDWPSKALCDSCTASARKVFRITYNKIL